MIVLLLLSSAIPTMEGIQGEIARQYSRIAQAIVGGSDASAHGVREDTGTLLSDLLPSQGNAPPLVEYDEGQEVPTAEEWRRLQGHLGKMERLGDRLAGELEGRR
jgi:hypothetical protein